MITYEPQPLFDKKGRIVKTPFQDRSYYILWEQFVVTKNPVVEESYSLRNTALDKNWICYPGEDAIWRRSVDAYTLKYTQPKFHYEIRDTILGCEVFKCTAIADDKLITAWHTEAFGTHYRLSAELPGIPISYEVPYLDYIVTVDAKTIDTQYISTEFFQHEKMREMIPTRIDPRNFGTKVLGFQEGIKEGQRMRPVMGRLLDGTKFERDAEFPIVYLFFAAMPDIGIYFKRLNPVITEFKDRVRFIAITYHREEQAHALLKIFPLDCPVMANKPTHFMRMGHQRNYFAIVTDRTGYVNDVIFEYPHCLEERLREACESLAQ